MAVEGMTFQANCPYCLTKSVAFTVRAVNSWDMDGSIEYFDLFGRCNYCRRSIVAVFRVPRTTPGLEAYMARGGHPYLIFPTLPSDDAPLHTPDPAARFFKQGRHNNMSGHWDAAGAMFRKALESALKSKFPALSGTLFSCIQEAGQQQQLDSNLVEWAHQIRMDGNEAVHGDEPRTKKKMQNS